METIYCFLIYLGVTQIILRILRSSNLPNIPKTSSVLYICHQFPIRNRYPHQSLHQSYSEIQQLSGNIDWAHLRAVSLGYNNKTHRYLIDINYNLVFIKKAKIHLSNLISQYKKLKCLIVSFQVCFCVFYIQDDYVERPQQRLRKFSGGLLGFSSELAKG